MPPSKQFLAVGGMWITVYGVQELLSDSLTSSKEAVVLFFLHGRFGSAERIEHIVHKTYEDAITAATPSSEQQQHEGEASSQQQDQSSSSSPASPVKRALLIVTLDHRNHGTRKISGTGQQSWTEGNMKHAQDMLAMQTGTAQDVSFLADFLPAFLFPNDEVRITKWAVTGISLGGHSVWIVLKNDPRFRIGIAMLGCPSYRVLMKHRAARSNLPYAPPYMPQSLLDLLERTDPDSVPSTSSDSSENPYIGRKILVLHGEKDELVPWESCKPFVENLEVGPDGHKSVQIEPDRGHEISSYMVGELVKWIVQYGMKE